jgi:hypothetical protein
MAVCSPSHSSAVHLRLTIRWHGFCGCSLMYRLEPVPVPQVQLLLLKNCKKELNTSV